MSLAFGFIFRKYCHFYSAIWSSIVKLLEMPLEMLLEMQATWRQLNSTFQMLLFLKK